MNISPLEPNRGKVAIVPAADYQEASDTINAFAVANGFHYQQSDPEVIKYSSAKRRSSPAWFGMTGFFAGKQINHVVNGSVYGFPMTMFLLTEKLTNGFTNQNNSKQQEEMYYRQQTSGVVRIKLPKFFPQVLLDSYKNDTWRGSVWASFRSNQLIPLEGDFADYFDVYSPHNVHLNTLVLLAPNMMEILKESSANFDVEFYGDEMVLFTRDLLYDPAVMSALDDALHEQLTYLARLLPSWNYQPVNPPFDVLRRGGTRGSTIRIGKWKILILTLVIFYYSSLLILIVAVNLLKN